MKQKIACLAAVLASLLLGAPAHAGVYADDLAKCLVKASSADDHVVMIRWMFSSMTQHPALKSISTVTPAQRDIYNRDMATVIQRMMFSDCRKEAVAGLKYEGMPALAAGFQLLGQVAARDIFGSPQVAQGLAALGTAFDKTKISALYKEAGVPEQQIPATQSGK